MKIKVVLILFAIFCLIIRLIDYYYNQHKYYRAIEYAEILTEEEYDIVKRTENLKLDYNEAKALCIANKELEKEQIRYDSICKKVKFNY